MSTRSAVKGKKLSGMLSSDFARERKGLGFLLRRSCRERFPSGWLFLIAKILHSELSVQQFV